MFSRDTTIAVAIALVHEIVANYNAYTDMSNPENLEPLEKAIRNNSISGVFSEVSFIYGTSSEILKEYYGCEVFDLKPRIEVGSEVFILDSFATIDNIVSDVPLAEMDDEEYKEVFTESTEEELDSSKTGVLINQMLLSIDWESLWKDKDFTGIASDSEAELYPHSSRPVHILDINSALESYGLPTISEFISIEHRKVPIKKKFDTAKVMADLRASNPRLYGNLVPKDPKAFDDFTDESEASFTGKFLNLVENYLEHASEDPRKLRAFGYISSEA